MPATAGPTARATLTSVEFRLTALRRSSGPTISRTKAWREGFSKQLLSPSTTARMHTSVNVTTPAHVKAASTRACSPINVWSRIMSRRLSTRSAITPP